MEGADGSSRASSRGSSAIEVLTPPSQFAIVEQGMYRSRMPSIVNFPFLKQLGLRHVVILSPDSVARNVASFFQDNGVTIWQTGARSGAKYGGKSSWKAIDDDIIKTSLEIMLRCDRHPLLICESSGIQLVGVVVGCLRRLEGWNLNSVINEYRSFAGAKARYNHEQSIELFDTDLVVVPENIPVWYADQIRMQQEDEENYELYHRNGLISATGKLSVVDPEDCGDLPAGSDLDKLAYRVHYYSVDTGPLNSVRSPTHIVPRLQRLTTGETQ